MENSNGFILHNSTFSDLSLFLKFCITLVNGFHFKSLILKSDEPENSTNDDSAMASQFISSDASLLTALKVGEGLEIRLQVEVGGTDFDVKIEHHEDGHGHHGHGHE